MTASSQVAPFARVAAAVRRGGAAGGGYGIWIALGVLVAASAVVAPGTLRGAALAGMLPLAGILAVAAVGQTLVVQQRGFDLSQAATMSLCGLLMASTAAAGQPLVLVVLVPLAVAVVVGVVNGLLVVRLSITPLIATLATNALLLGAVWTYGRGLPVGAPPGLQAFVRSDVTGVPAVALVAVLLVAVAAVVERRTVLGRDFVVVGASPAAARAAGIAGPYHVVGAYVASALCAGLGGALLVGFAGTATATLGDSYLLPVVAAVVVGGTPLTGGAGSVVASAVAAVFLTQLGQVTLALGAPTSSQLLVQSLSIVLAVVLRSARRPGRGRQRRRERLRVRRPHTARGRPDAAAVEPSPPERVAGQR